MENRLANYPALSAYIESRSALLPAYQWGDQLHQDEADASNGGRHNPNEWSKSVDEQQTTWDERMAQEKAAREVRNQEFRTIGQQIATHLGEGWQLHASDAEADPFYPWLQLDYLPKCLNNGIKADCSLSISHNRYGHKNSYHIRSDGPSGNRLEGFSINVSDQKSPLQIASDIQRRILKAGYFDAFDKAVEKIRQSNQFADDKWQTTQDLAAIIGYQFSERELAERTAQLFWYIEGRRGYGDAHISSADSIALTISCNKETASKILELIGK